MIFRKRWGRLILRFAVLLFICLVLFSLFNFKSRCRYEMPTIFSDPVFANSGGKPRCRIDLSTLGLVSLDMETVLSMEAVEMRHEDIQRGGKWFPLNCKSWQKLAILIAYRQRYEHLIMLLARLHDILRQQMVSYRIFVVQQAGDGVFNKGRLYNLGILGALDKEDFDCFIFHDVDLLPEHNANIYYCDDNVRHLSSAVDEMRYHTMYYNLIGGVISISRASIFDANGYSNEYWGWGNEDDDLSARTEAMGLLITRPPEYIGRYKMIKHPKRQRSGNNYHLLLTWRSRWKSDGLNSVSSTGSRIISRTDSKLYTNITVDVGLPPEKTSDNDSLQQESIFWFLNFFFP